MSVCRIRTILTAATLIAAGFGTPVGAQTPLTEAPLKLGQRYWVTQADGVEIQGYLTARTPLGVQVSTDRGHVTIPTADVFRVEKPDGLKHGALIGAGAGAAFIFLSVGSDRGPANDGLSESGDFQRAGCTDDAQRPPWHSRHRSVVNAPSLSGYSALTSPVGVMVNCGVGRNGIGN